MFPAQQSLPFLKTKSYQLKMPQTCGAKQLGNVCRHHLIVSPGEVGRALVGRFSSASAGLPLQQIDLVCVKTCLSVTKKTIKKSCRIALSVLFLAANKPDRIHLCCGTRGWNWVEDNLCKVEVPGVTVVTLDCQVPADLEDIWDFDRHCKRKPSVHLHMLGWWFLRDGLVLAPLLRTAEFEVKRRII